MLTAVLGPLASVLTGGLMDRIEGAFKAYVQGQISREHLAAQVTQALLATFADVEKAYADALTKNFSAFMQAASQSILMQVVWGTVVLSQLFVLFWYQWVVPFLVTYGYVKTYASAGSTIDWAYAIVGGGIGLAALTMRSNPVDKLRSLVGK